MKRKFTKLGGALLALLMVPSVAQAQTTLASWDFTKKYTTADEGTARNYTPSNEAFEGIDKTAFSTVTPTFYPVTYTGTQTNYTLSGTGSEWRLYDVYGGADCFQIADNPQNTLSDITDPTTHNSYFEFSFPTTGYKDIVVNAKISYDNNGACPVAWVISTDGGSTWADGGTTNTTGNWWTLADSGDKSFGIANQPVVKIRLIGAGNNNTKWFGVNQFNVLGTAITDEVIYKATAIADNTAHGSVDVSPVGGCVETGTSVTVTATHKTGWKFKEWQLGGSSVSTNNPYSFDISANTDLTAVFVPNVTYTLATSSNISYAGKVTRSLYAVEYDENAVVTLTATPNVGYAFVEWQDGLSNQLSTANPYDVTMTENKTVVAVYEIDPIAAGTTITAASWTFDTGYDISGLIYTPNTDEWAAIAQTQAKNNQVKVFNANTSYSAPTNYEATISNDDTGKTYYSIKDNNSDKVFSLYPSGISNSVTDYTNSAEHLVYYQFSFPTSGLKDVSISFYFTYGSNAVRNLELVYSTDGGTTWTDGGACAGGANWYTYAETTKSINADNKSSVIVRLLPANGEEGDYRMNSFTVKGTIATDAITISDKLYATYYNSVPVQLPANVQAATVDGEAGGKLTLNWRYAAGDVIPGGTPVLLKATAADNYDLTYVANDASAAPTGNYLYGSDVAVTTTGGGTGAKYYALQDGTNGLGFYWMEDEGAAFTSGAHKAWLALPAATPAPFFSLFNDMQTTSINDVRSKMADIRGDFFDLQGRKVANPTKGLYIVNGKKVAIK